MALLIVVAWAVTRNYLSNSLFAWGDHPGQFMRFWYPLAHAIPDSGRGLWGVSGWNPVWYAGYPEMQFYPPGTTLLGITLYYLALGTLNPEQVYNLIPAIAFALPLFTCYAFLRYALAPVGIIPSSLAGVAAGLLAISLKPMWGGIEGVLIGLMGERLAFGFAPVVLLAGWWLVERPTLLRLSLASILLAMLLLLHPFHAPAVVIAIALYAAARHQWRSVPGSPPLALRTGKALLWLGGWLLLAVGLIAWWLIPLLTHYNPYAAALVRATTDQVISWFDAGRIEWLWLAALMALMLLAHANSRVNATVVVLALLAPLLVGAILFNDQVLLARFGITMLDPIRFIAEYYLALILLVGCAVAAITSSFLWRICWLAAICTVIVIVTLRPYVELAWSDLQTRMVVPPAWTLNNLLQHPAFDGYWDALRSDPTSGRIFFVSNYLFLPGENGEVTPTTVNSLTPYLIGREIVGGTFSHWSPVARWLWVGDPWARLLPAQVEHAEQQLFGKPWDELSEEEVVTSLTRLNVTTVVAEATDTDAIALFESSPNFTRYWQNSFFSIYHLAANPGEWIEARNANAQVSDRNARRWIIDVNHAEPEATLLLKMGHYPLWRAALDGRDLPLAATADALQQVMLPEGGPYQLEISYRKGRPEWLGLIVSLASLLIALALLMRRGRWAQSER